MNPYTLRRKTRKYRLVTCKCCPLAERKNLHPGELRKHERKVENDKLSAAAMTQGLNADKFQAIRDAIKGKNTGLRRGILMQLKAGVEPSKLKVLSTTGLHKPLNAIMRPAVRSLEVQPIVEPSTPTTSWGDQALPPSSPFAKLADIRIG